MKTKYIVLTMNRGKITGKLTTPNKELADRINGTVITVKSHE